MRYIIINIEKSDTWKILLAIGINFISPKHVDEERVIHSNSNNIEFRPYDNTDEVVDELTSFKIPNWFRNINDFIFNSFQLLYNKCHKINFKRRGSYIDSVDWIKKKKAMLALNLGLKKQIDVQLTQKNLQQRK